MLLWVFTSNETPGCVTMLKKGAKGKSVPVSSKVLQSHQILYSCLLHTGFPNENVGTGILVNQGVKLQYVKKVHIHSQKSSYILASGTFVCIDMIL